MKLWIGVAVVVVFLVLILIIIGIVKTKNKKIKADRLENALTGETLVRQPDGTVVDPLLEQIKADYDKCLLDKDAADRLRKLRELYNIET